MALTKITANVIEAGAISTASLADTSITADKLAATLDLTGKAITVATASAGDNDTTVASTAFVSTAIANLADSAPSTLNTLNELAAALGDDANFSTTVTNSIATKLPLAGGTLTGDLNFGDSDKAIFGAGSDLQIYHDGSNSIVQEVGTGDLRLAGNVVRIRNSADTENMISAVQDGAVTLCFDGNGKLATTSTGIDVTGTATMDGLTVDGASTAVFSGGQYIRVDGNAAGFTDLEPVLWARSKVGASIAQINVKGSQWQFGGGGTLDANPAMTIDYASGDISFYEDTGTTAKLFWDASEETLFVDQKIKVGNTTDGVVLQTSAGMGSIIGTDTGGNGWNALDIRAGSATQLYLNTSGNVGIGTTAPAAKLQVEEYGVDTTTTSTTATTQVAIHTFAAATFRSARFTVQITNSTDSTYHLTEILMIHDGTTPSITEYGTIFTGSAEATFDADISSGNVRLLATPASTDTMEFKVVAHSITT
jgi:hypothetical protein